MEYKQEKEKENIIDILKEFKDTESINDRFLLKDKKKEKSCDPYNINLNNDTNPFIKEIKNNINKLDIDEPSENSEDTEKELENEEQIKKLDDTFIEKLILVGDKTKKTNNFYYQSLIYANKKFIINYTRKAAAKYNNVKFIFYNSDNIKIILIIKNIV